MPKKGPAGLALILGGGKPPPGDEAEMPMGDEAKHEAMRDMMAAFKSGDAGTAAAAFKRAYDACAASEGSEYEEEA